MKTRMIQCILKQFGDDCICSNDIKSISYQEKKYLCNAFCVPYNFSIQLILQKTNKQAKKNILLI